MGVKQRVTVSAFGLWVPPPLPLLQLREHRCEEHINLESNGQVSPPHYTSPHTCTSDWTPSVQEGRLWVEQWRHTVGCQVS